MVDFAYAKNNKFAENFKYDFKFNMGACGVCKYATSMPICPDGFAEPDKSPRYPQDLAELMGVERLSVKVSLKFPKV
jgi:hypothetical protein